MTRLERRFIALCLLLIAVNTFPKTNDWRWSLAVGICVAALNALHFKVQDHISEAP